MILYHITKLDNLPSIMIEGLLPGNTPGMKVYGSRCTEVYLTNDIDRIIEEQCGHEYIRNNKCIVLHIDVSEIALKPVEYRDGATYTISDFEFTTGTITPNKIVEYVVL